MVIYGGSQGRPERRKNINDTDTCGEKESC